MGNLFLGFPVSKAKIAEQISGTAAPSAHHTQHENGGSDEIDATGLTGAGGGGIALDEFINISMPFESMTGYSNDSSNSGTITAYYGGLLCDTGSTASSYAWANKYTAQSIREINFSKDCVINFNATFQTLTSVTGIMMVRLGGNGSAKGIGIKVVDGILKGSVGNGSAETTVDLETLGTGVYNQTRMIKIIYTAGVSAKFYVNDVLLGTISTGLPSSYNATTGNIFMAYARNPSVAEIKYLILAYFNARIKA